MLQPGDSLAFGSDEVTQFSVTLESENNSARTSDSQGTWSMVYDQSLHIRIEESIFLANFRYDVKDTVPLSNYTSLETSDYDLFDSRCDQTLVGFFKSADG